MKKVIFVATLCVLGIINTSCDDNNDDGDSGTQYPITLKFSEIEETFNFYQNGAETQVTDEALNEYYTSFGGSSNKEELEEQNKDDYIKFLSDTEAEIYESGDTYTGNYEFNDGFFYILSEDSDEKILYGKGDTNKLEYLYAAVFSVKENSSSGYSDGYDSEPDIPYFPTTFEGSKDFHKYENISEIEGESYLLIHNLSNVYLKE